MNHCKFLASSQGTRDFLSAVNGNSDARCTQVQIGNGKFFLGVVNGNSDAHVTYVLITITNHNNNLLPLL